jgi:hypothetical protein
MFDVRFSMLGAIPNIEKRTSKNEHLKTNIEKRTSKNEHRKNEHRKYGTSYFLRKNSNQYLCRF